ncbi:uncharacterized protein [Glycine max]|uniref:uncharacterized protein n=1 Tax=Glycine max TaxID=3847 RepID=UPI001B3552C1|nr:uncharacterized protein LOC102663349 [Glycine max]
MIQIANKKHSAIQIRVREWNPSHTPLDLFRLKHQRKDNNTWVDIQVGIYGCRPMDGLFNPQDQTGLEHKKFLLVCLNNYCLEFARTLEQWAKSAFAQGNPPPNESDVWHVVRKKKGKMYGLGMTGMSCYHL